MPDLVRIVDTLNRKGVALRVLNINLDTATPTGKLMLHMLGAISEFERMLMLERQRDGIAAAKDAGKYKGRKPTARAKAGEVLRLASEGLKRQEIPSRPGWGWRRFIEFWQRPGRRLDRLPRNARATTQARA